MSTMLFSRRARALDNIEILMRHRRHRYNMAELRVCSASAAAELFPGRAKAYNANLRSRCAAGGFLLLLVFPAPKHIFKPKMLLNAFT